MSGQSDSRFRKYLGKAKKLMRPREKEKHKSNVGSTASLPPVVTTEHASSPFKNANAASSYERLPSSSHKTQVYHAEPQEMGGGPLAQAPVSSQLIGTHRTSSRQSLLTTLGPTPWETWKLDQDFLSQVCTWNAAHPENTLDRILNKTSTFIERHDVLLELVPDGPIPFRGFVKALAHLVKLGTTVAEAKMVALQFAEDILHWVEKLAAAFGDSEGGHFISKAWANLAEIRNIIEDVCTWAHRILNIKLGERASVNKKISQYQVKFGEAIGRFGVVSNIHIALGQDRANKHLENITRAQDGLAAGQDRTNQELATMRRTLAQTRQSTLPEATYQVQKKIPCDPGTRKQVLDDIMKWIFDISEGSPCFFWLSGDPGVGKSAVTASIARECNHRNVLWAQYFINRNDAQTVDPQLYFPSIAKQMSACLPAVDHAVQQTLRDHPYLMNDDISLDQATKLFVDTIRVAAASTPTMPVAVVIDALDETDAKRLKVTADIFSRVVVNLPHNAKVFISSRVETVIRDKFAALPRAYNIHLSARNSIPDVTAYLKTKVDEIMTDHHIDWFQWGEERMRRLCLQASGLFIWAVTAIEYIRSQIEESGTECLAVVLEELNTKGKDDINVLYQTILRRTYQNERSLWQMQRFQRIVGAILVQQTPLSVEDLKGLLGLRNPNTDAPVDVEHFVRRLRTILVPGVAEITGRTIPRVHKSFSDFITTTKAEEFRVNLTDSNGELALQCIDRLERLWKSNIAGEMPGQLRYAIAHWSSHLTRVIEMPVDVQETDDGDTVSVDSTHSLVSSPEKDPGASDSAEPMSMKKPAGYEKLYSISVSPDGTCIAYARGKSILLRDTETGDFRSKSPKGHTMDINSALFSPDGRYIISASDDETIQIWDVTTGEPVGQPLEGHEHYVLSAFFSPDCSQVVSAAVDSSVCIWDAETGKMLHHLQHDRTVRSALFSPDGRHLVSTSDDQTVYVWDATNGQKVHVLKGHDSTVVSAFYSPDGNNVLSVDKWGNIMVWDSETGQRLSEYFTSSASKHPKLSFISEAGAYIVTPPKSNTSPALSSYVFRVGEDGVAGGISNGWVYTNPKKRFRMGMYLGQLIMIHDPLIV